MESETFGQFLTSRLAELRMPQAELARKVLVSDTAVGNWVNKGTQPKSKLIAPLAEALGVEPSRIEQLTGRPGASTASVSRRPGRTGDRLGAVIATLPPDRLETLLDFAEYLGMKDWREEQERFALANLAEAYGEDEPDYTLADIKP